VPDADRPTTLPHTLYRHGRACPGHRRLSLGRPALEKFRAAMDYVTSAELVLPE
jgi:hypothetical protein